MPTKISKKVSAATGKRSSSLSKAGSSGSKSYSVMKSSLKDTAKKGYGSVKTSVSKVANMSPAEIGSKVKNKVVGAVKTGTKRAIKGSSKAFPVASEVYKAGKKGAEIVGKTTRATKKTIKESGVVDIAKKNFKSEFGKTGKSISKSSGSKVSSSGKSSKTSVPKVKKATPKKKSRATWEKNSDGSSTMTSFNGGRTRSAPVKTEKVELAKIPTDTKPNLTEEQKTALKNFKVRKKGGSIKKKQTGGETFFGITGPESFGIDAPKKKASSVKRVSSAASRAMKKKGGAMSRLDKMAYKKKGGSKKC